MNEFLIIIVITERGEILDLNIKVLRLSTGMTQAAFAKEFDIPIKTIQGWERKNGKSPPPHVLRMIHRIIKLEGLDQSYELPEYRAQENSNHDTETDP